MLCSFKTTVWKQDEETLIETIAEEEDKSKRRTDMLFEHSSPAAQFIRNIGKDFSIPSLLSAATINVYCKMINALAKQIEGADLLPENGVLWTTTRRSATQA